MVFHNGFKYDYYFIIKNLAEVFKGQFECLEENAEKYITFSVPVKKDKVKFIDSIRIMSSSLSCLVDNFSTGLHNDKCTDYIQVLS